MIRGQHFVRAAHPPPILGAISVRQRGRNYSLELMSTGDGRNGARAISWLEIVDGASDRPLYWQIGMVVGALLSVGSGFLIYIFFIFTHGVGKWICDQLRGGANGT